MGNRLKLHISSLKDLKSCPVACRDKSDECCDITNDFQGVFRKGQMNHRYGFFFPFIALLFIVYMLHGCTGTEKTETRPLKPAYHVRELPWPPPPFDLSANPHHSPMLEEVNYQRPLPANLPDTRIVISKTDRILSLYSGNRLVRRYPVSLGFDPDNDKEKEGDGRTPEGIFYICSKNPASNFFLSLGISYPNMEDAERGLREGIITREQYNQIVRAMKKGKRPPWFTKLGGAICIHGGGVDWDWTAGCIAMENRHVRELFRAVSVGTPVIIKNASGIRYSNRWRFRNRSPLY
jgi:lipoprotein-anchoring transpeptidase ErfK/SrfK